MDPLLDKTSALDLVVVRLISSIPGSKTNLLLYSSEIRLGSMAAESKLLPLRMLSKSSTFFFDNRLMLVCHDVLPVPVDTQRPELFVFVIICDVLGRM